MTAVYIIAGILLLILALLYMPVRAGIDFSDGDFTFCLYLWFIKVYDSARTRKKKPEKEISENKKEEKDGESGEKKRPKLALIFEHKKQQLGTANAIGFFIGVLRSVLEKLVGFVRKLRFDRFILDLAVASDDAAATAIHYGAFCTAIYPTLSFLSLNTNLSLKEVNISADFNKTAVDFRISMRIRARIIYFLVLGIGLLLQYIKLLKDDKNYGGKQNQQSD